MNIRTTIVVWSMLVFSSGMLQAQEMPPKFSITGLARSVYFADRLDQELAVPDSVTPPLQNSGHALADMGLSIRPHQDLEVMGMVRIRNDFGGFWGAGVTFDVRQLYLKGVIRKTIRYQLGDIDYNLTPFTLYNNEQELYGQMPAFLQTWNNLVMYDNFHLQDRAWRQQGASVDFGFKVNKVIKEADVYLFTSRVAASNLSSLNDRLFSSAHLEWLQSSFLKGSFTYANLYDIYGTSRALASFSNPVFSTALQSDYALQAGVLQARIETGFSSSGYEGDSLAPALTDRFFDGAISFKPGREQVTFKAGYLWVGPDFRSAGAQTKRINFMSTPESFQRITNSQLIRPFTMFDLMRESDLYNLQLQSGLMAFNPLYSNVSPYGVATPNRQGPQVSLSYQPENVAVEGDVSLQWLTEIRGQGTTNYRQFMRIASNWKAQAGAVGDDGDSRFRFDAHLAYEDTRRDSHAEGVPAVDLTVFIAGLGVQTRIMEQTDLVLGGQWHQYDGFELLPVTDTYDQVVNFTEFSANGNQWIASAGLTHYFTEKVFLTGQYQLFNQQSNTISTIPAYRISNLSMAFNMKF